MLLQKPTWVTHDEDLPIFSVDVHPKGGRFATGGQGKDCGLVVIWNLAPVLSEEAECDPTVPKMLCQMDNHIACVNIIRWSCQGHLLASGGDDKVIMIWKLTGDGSSAIFGTRKVNVETWKCVSTLTSHTGDVLDLAWAPHDGWLASCSVDNTVIVWNTLKHFEKVQTLLGHTGLVKGVAWDPVGKYLASQSDDRTLRVWRTSDWGQQILVTEPFEECSGTTHVLRLSWSPDGQYLVSAHAMNGGGPTAQIIERDGWKQDKDFVGHRKAVTCVRFNSNILQKTFPGSPKTQQYCCCAIGSRDRALSVWLTSLKRPLVVIHDLFTDSVLDLSWSSDGLILLACSWDGTIACVQFGTDEIGKPLSAADKNLLYERMYGKSLQKNWNQSFSGSQIVENPEMLTALEEQSAKQAQPKAVPVVVPSEKPPSTPVSTPVVPVQRNKQIETLLPNGKRRITPMLVTSLPTDTSKNDIPIPQKTEMKFSSSSPSKSKIIIEKVENDETTQTINQSSTQSAKTPKRTPLIHTEQLTPGVKIDSLVCKDVPGDVPVVQYISTLEPIKMQPSGVYTRSLNHNLKIKIRNETSSYGTMTLIQIFRVNVEQPFWETYLGAHVLCYANNRKILVLTCADQSLNIYCLRSGARLLPQIILEDLCAAVSLTENGKCLTLTRSGLLQLWDVDHKRKVFNRVSIRGLLSTSCTVRHCYLTSEGLPVVVLSDGRAYTYHLDLCTWMLLSNPQDSVNRAGAGVLQTLPQNLPLALLQKSHQFNITHDIVPPGVTLSFLENQLNAALILNSPKEFKHWLIVTVEHLLNKGPECRLRSILNFLLGRPFGSHDNSELIMGMKKNTLLDEILTLVGSKLSWQRLYKEYKELIEFGKELDISVSELIN